MTAFENLRKSSEAIIAICEKEKHTKEDKNKLLKINQEISVAIEDLMECEGCSQIATANQIATITLGAESAKLCKDCGIKSLEAGKIYKKKPTRRRTRRAQKVEEADKPETAENTGKVKSSASKTSAPKTEKPVPEPPKENQKPDLNELYGEVEAQTGINKRDVKKIHKLIEEIAVPMDLENTIIYTVAELEKSRMKIEPPAAEKAVAILFNG